MVEELLKVLRREGLDGEVVDEDGGPADASNHNGDEVVSEGGVVYLTLQQNQGPWDKNSGTHRSVALFTFN